MTAHSIRRLHECDQMLNHILTNYSQTIRRLHDAQPGYPARTPASGDPGSSQGFTAGSTVERLANKPSPERRDLLDAITLPNLIAQAAHNTATGAHLTLIDVPDGPRATIRRIAYTRWLLHQLIAQEHEPANRHLETLHRRTAELDAIIRRWGPLITPKKQAAATTTDLTEMWCTACLTAGIKSPRKRGDRCSWCYDFERTYGFTPPAELLEMRQTRRIYDRDIDRIVKEHKDRQKQKQRKRRKAG